MEPGSRVRFKTAFDNTTTEPLSKLLFKAKTIVRSVALRLSRLALWLLLALKVTIKTSFNLAYNLGIMSSLTGGRKFLDTFRGLSNTKSTEDQIKDLEVGPTTASSDGWEKYWENDTSELAASLIHNMAAPTQPRDKAKEDAEHEELNKLLDQVTREVQEAGGKMGFIPDGDRTRYQKPSPLKTTKSDERTDMRPQPLQPRSASRTMVAAEEEEESLADFLKTSEPIAILHEQHVSELAAQKAAAEYIEQTKHSSETALLAPLRRKISSTFTKDTPEQPKPADLNSPSPSQTRGGFFRKPSSTKSLARGADGLRSISENDPLATSALDATGESSPSATASPSPGTKSSNYRPLLSVNTLQANKNITNPLKNPPAAQSVSSKDGRFSKHTSPSRADLSSVFMPTSKKSKVRKLKDNDPSVKAIERQILREEFGVNTTSQLTSASVKRPRARATSTSVRDHNSSVASTAQPAVGSYQTRLNSDVASNSASPTRSLQASQRQNSNTTSNASLPFAEHSHQREQSYTSFGSTGSVVRCNTGPHSSFESTVSTATTYDSRDSTHPNSKFRSSGDTSQSVTIPGTPETPDTRRSIRVRRKAVDSGSGRRVFSEFTTSPTSSLGRAAGKLRGELFGDGYTDYDENSPRRGDERSFTDPCDGQSGISSIVRAARSAFLEHYDRAIADSYNSSFEQQSASSRGGSFADSNTSLIPRPLRHTGVDQLDASLDDSNSSSQSTSTVLGAQSRLGRNLNWPLANPPVGPAAVTSSARPGYPAERNNRAASDPFQLSNHSSFNRATEAHSSICADNAAAGSTESLEYVNVSPVPAPLRRGYGNTQVRSSGFCVASSDSPPLSSNSAITQGRIQEVPIQSNIMAFSPDLNSTVGCSRDDISSNAQSINASPSQYLRYPNESRSPISRGPSQRVPQQLSPVSPDKDQNAPVHSSRLFKSPSQLVRTILARDFQNVQTTGAPSNRLKLEEDAEEDRRLKRMSKKDYVAYRDYLLRQKTKTEIVFYNKHDRYPPNPNHGRQFHSKNLRCGQCTSSCAICKAPCCAFKNATLTLSSTNSNPVQKAQAKALVKEITAWINVGEDNQTFLTCSECERLVCPECISICPVEPCYDRLCKDCNHQNFWQPCLFHTDTDIEWSLKRQQDRMGIGLI